MTLARVRGTWTGVGGSPAYLTFYMDLEPGTAQAGADSMAAFMDGFADRQLPQVRWTVDDLVVYIDPVTGQPTGSTSVTSATGTGSNSGTMVPRASQVLVRWRTGNYPVGREIVGKTYVPYTYGGAMQSDGTMVDAERLAYQGVAEDLLTTPGLTAPVVWSRKLGQFFATETVDVWDEYAVMRSRRD